MIPLYILAVTLSFLATFTLFNAVLIKVQAWTECTMYNAYEERFYHRYAGYVTCSTILPLLIPLLIFTEYEERELIVTLALIMVTWLYSVLRVSLITWTVKRFGHSNIILPAFYMTTVINIILLINFM